MSAPFEVSTDPSGTGIECVLSQRDDSGRDQPVLFASKALTNNKLNWHTRDKEAYTFNFALQKCRALPFRAPLYLAHRSQRTSIATKHL